MLSLTFLQVHAIPLCAPDLAALGETHSVCPILLIELLHLCLELLHFGCVQPATPLASECTLLGVECHRQKAVVALSTSDCPLLLNCLLIKLHFRVTF